MCVAAIPQRLTDMAKNIVSISVTVTFKWWVKPCAFLAALFEDLAINISPLRGPLWSIARRLSKLSVDGMVFEAR